MRIVIDDLNVFLDNEIKGITFNDYKIGKEKLVFPKSSTEIHPVFPPEEQLLIELNKIEWVCKMLKVLKKSFSSECEEMLIFVSRFQMCLLRELVSTFENEIVPSQINDFESLIEELDEEGPESRNLIHVITAIKSAPRWEKKLFNLYQKVKKTFFFISRSTLEQLGRYGLDPNTQTFDVLKSLGKCACEFSKGFHNKGLNLKEIKLEEGNTKENISKINHNIMLLENMKSALYIDYLPMDQIFEFYKNGGLENLQELYQSTVDIVGKIHNSADNSFKSLVINLGTSIVKIYVTIMKPSNIVTLSSSIMSKATQADLIKEGFKGIENFIATLLVIVVENLIFKTNYGEFKSAIKFLAECMNPAFTLLIDVLRNYPKKETIEGLINALKSSIQDWRRLIIDIPSEMIDTLSSLGFGREECEDALRRHNLNATDAIAELLLEREKNAASPQQNVPPQLKSKIVAAKELPKEFSGWMDHFLTALYEALYSISNYKCKYLLYSLSEFQENHRPYKIKNAFKLLLNELQTLLFSIELSYQPTFAQNDEFPISELSETTMTEKFRNKVKKYTAVEGGITENELIVLHKMSALIDIISTFLRLSKTNELLNIMCQNKIAQCLIEVLAKLLQKELILPGRKLIPKILVLLAMMYKEVNQTYQGEMFEQNLGTIEESKEKNISSAPKVKASDLLPIPEDVNRLVGLLSKLIESDEAVTAMIKSLTLTKPKLSYAFITSEIITTIVLLLCHLTKNPTNAKIVIQNGILQKILVLKTISGSREKIPSGLISELVFNLLETPELLGKYMERIIKSVLFAKAQWLNKNQPLPQNETELMMLQKNTGIDMDQFLGSMNFLITRNTFIFFQACNKCAILRKEMQKDSLNKITAKNFIVLKIDYLKEMLADCTLQCPKIPFYVNRKFVKGKAGLNYYFLLEKSIKENEELMKSAFSGITSQLFDRLITIHFERKEYLSKLIKGEKNVNPKIDYLISEKMLLDLIGQIVRIYPESLANLFMFKSQNPKITGNTLISFLLSSVFPLGYISGKNSELKIERDEDWKNKTIQLIKYMTFENKHLNQTSHKILIKEMRRRIISEIWCILKRAVKLLKPENFKSESARLNTLSESFSSLSILEGLLLTEGNSVTHPKTNEYEIMKEILSYQHKSILKLCSKIIQNSNLHSSQSDFLVTCSVNLLERITRFNNWGAKIKLELVLDPEKLKEDNLQLKEIELYNGLYIEDGGEARKAEESDSEEENIPEEYDISENVEEEELPIPAEETEKSVVEEKKQPEEKLESPILLYANDDGDSNDQDMDDEVSLMALQEIRRRHLFAFEDVDDELQILQDRWRHPQQRNRQRIRPNRNVELDTVQVKINSDALDTGKNKDIKCGLGAIYERESTGDTNNEIMKQIGGDILGEEKLLVHNQLVREVHRGRFVLERFIGNPAFMREEEEEKKEELPEVSLFGYTIDKRNINNLVKNQLIGKLETQVIMPEEPKKEIPIPQPEKKIEEKKGAAPENKEEIKKTEIKKEEVKNEQQTRVEQELKQALITRRREELAQLVPDLRIEDDNIILQIDPEFLIDLSPEMRRQSIQSLISQQRAQNNSLGSGPREPSEMDPATFIATIADENIRDEILMTAEPEFIAALPANLISTIRKLERKSKLWKTASKT